jgi:homoserine kinase
LVSSSQITVRAPATSANLGPGFDCLGLALDLWNEVRATAGTTQADDAENLILRSARAVFDHVGAAYPGFTLQCDNRIPFGRGLGSSSAAIASGILLANACLGTPLDRGAVLRLATALEGHPDNIAPCLLGGIRAAAVTEDGQVIEVPISAPGELRTVVFVPEQAVPTAHARGVLPVSVPRSDAIFNVARSSLLVAALAAGRIDALAEATRDRLHQPYRLPLFPPGATLLDIAMQSGALGAFVSGAGPTVLALCHASTIDAIVDAFIATARRLDVPGQAWALELTTRGAHIVA